MSKFKIGDVVVVVNAQSTYNNYFSGDAGVITEYDGSRACFVERGGDGLIMNVYFTEIKHYGEKEKEMNVEQMRDEVVRIDKRIEEASKDIENAQKEREALVEKIREKGFVLADETASRTVEDAILKVGDLVITGYSPHRHDTNYTGWFEASHVKKFKQ